MSSSMGAKFSAVLNRLRKNKTAPNMDDKLEKIILQGFLKAPRATEEEVMKQLQEEGIIPTLRRQGGVAFEVPLAADKPRGQARRRVQFSSHKKSLWSREEKMIIAGIHKEEHLDLRRKTARKEEEKRRRAAERKSQQQILRQLNRSEKLYRKMAAVENRKRELDLLRKRVLPPIRKDVSDTGG